MTKPGGMHIGPRTVTETTFAHTPEVAAALAAEEQRAAAYVRRRLDGDDAALILAALGLEDA